MSTRLLILTSLTQRGSVMAKRITSIPGFIISAVKAFPITGNALIDAKFLTATGHLESSFSSPDADHPGSTAIGYFGMTRAARSDVKSKYGIIYSHDPLTQAKAASAYYRLIFKGLQRSPRKVFPLSVNPIKNTLLNLRLRFVTGLGSSYLTSRDGKVAVSRMSEYIHDIVPSTPRAPLGSGDISSIPSNVKFMTTQLASEFILLPTAVKSSFVVIAGSLRDTNCFVSSIKSTYSGKARTKENGPNHYHLKAIDFVPTPFDRPQFYDQDGQLRSPHFNWNVAFQHHLVNLFKTGSITCAVYLESDHVHLDSTSEPGIYTYSSHRSAYRNDDVACVHTLKTGVITRLA